MDIRLDGKVIIVTGATQGVGEAVARLAAESGAAGIMVTGRNPERGKAVVERIAAIGAPAAFVAADLVDASAPQAIVAACIGRFGRVDGLVNAAALTDRASLLDGTQEFWDRMLIANARAPFFLMQHCVNDMRRRRAPGAIVNVLSVNIHCGLPSLAIYSASKGALAVLTRNIANAHKEDRIRVNGIVLGWTDTPSERQMQAVTLGRGEGWLEAASRAQPFGRLLAPDDVGRLAVFLLSDAAGPMTGALIDQEQRVAGAPG
ncbi:MAG: SDR family oxidoreductase [Methylobacteriaceae bacterium]|nr:SDR family oxidoreductase [Methylobacteriaceae bacterium]